MGGNTLLIGEVSAEWPDWFNLATVTEITTFFNCGEQKIIINHMSLRLLITFIEAGMFF